MKIIIVLVAVFAAFVPFISAFKSPCLDPAGVMGPCRASIPSWTFNSHSPSCVRFMYGGCGGNNNRFGSKESCERQCLRVVGRTRPRKL
ncbi:protease inhibitor-like [Haematobia irritans]|uniref:protease inhibitor-like n=1 Tax=Haematobia irritans TaxID=7368 RepID=UPI003F4FB606